MNKSLAAIVILWPVAIGVLAGYFLYHQFTAYAQFFQGLVVQFPKF